MRETCGGKLKSRDFTGPVLVEAKKKQTNDLAFDMPDTVKAFVATVDKILVILSHVDVVHLG